MNRKLLIAAAVALGVALLALLAYSLERTAWLFGLFEQRAGLAIAAAVVVELAAVALLAGSGAVASLDDTARRWANRALGCVLAVQALANLSAGYLRGGVRTLDLLGGSLPAYAVAAALWLVSNLAIPALILFLSKLLERVIARMAERAPQPTIAPARAAPHAAEQPPQPPAKDRTRIGVSAERLAVYLAVLDVFDRNPRASTDDIAAATATSRRTAESRRSELVKLGALHRTPDGFERNGVDLVAE